MNKGIQMSLIGAENLETGFISSQVINIIDKQELIDTANSLRYICQVVTKSLEEHATVPTKVQSGMIFQYFFDRAVEIFYKQYHGIDTDSVSFNIQEVFEYYEPDMPYNIQQILTNRVGNIVLLTGKLWKFMEETGVFETPFSMWFSNYLSIATTLGLRFAQEIDFDDQSELNAFLNQD